jgi:hypothetical protein
VDQVRALDAGGHRKVDRHRLERRIPRERVPRPVGLRTLALRAEAVHRQLDKLPQLAREVLDVHAGAAVDLGWVLAREK